MSQGVGVLGLLLILTRTANSLCSSKHEVAMQMASLPLLSLAHKHALAALILAVSAVLSTLTTHCLHQ